MRNVPLALLGNLDKRSNLNEFMRMGRVKKRTKEFERRKDTRKEKRRKFLGHITSFTQQRVCRARPIEVA
jgi:hypothetical protein